MNFLRFKFVTVSNLNVTAIRAFGVKDLRSFADGDFRIIGNAKGVRGNKNDETDCTILIHGTCCKVETQEGDKRHKALSLSVILHSCVRE
jgi:hypothetical protein